MQISNTTPAASTAPAGSSLGSRKAEAKPGQQFDYMKLIVAQMRNLNPMDPSSGGDSLPTMMQAESLNQLTQLNKALGDLQAMMQTGYASTLIGRTVTGLDGGDNQVSGAVKGLMFEGGSPTLELTSGKRVRLLDVTSVSST